MHTRLKITAEEFETVAAEIGPSELVRGEVVRLSPAGFQHSRIVTRLACLLDQWARRSGRGRVLSGEAGVIVESDPDTVRGADVAYISYERMPKGREPSGFFSTPPELVAEVVGAGQGWKKLVDKAGQYLAIGVDRVWVIDPKSRRVHVFCPDAEPGRVEQEESLSDEALLPGFSCAVRELFED